MGKKKKGFSIFLLFIILINIAVFLSYLINFYDPTYLKDWEGDPNWTPPEYYKEGIADSKIEECARYADDNLEFSQ